jgi:hypothetical protein
MLSVTLIFYKPKVQYMCHVGDALRICHIAPLPCTRETRGTAKWPTKYVKVFDRGVIILRLYRRMM